MPRSCFAPAGRQLLPMTIHVSGILLKAQKPQHPDPIFWAKAFRNQKESKMTVSKETCARLALLETMTSVIESSTSLPSACLVTSFCHRHALTPTRRRVVQNAE